MTTIATNAVLVPALDEMAGRINELHREAETSARRAVECAVEAGRLLGQAKEACGHGQFGKWITVNCDFSQRTAQTYMRIANHPNAQRAAHLSLREAVKALAEPKKEPVPTEDTDDRLQELETKLEDVLVQYAEQLPARADALRKIRDEKLWQDGFNSFPEYCQERANMDGVTARRMIKLGGRLKRAIRMAPEHRREIILRHKRDLWEVFDA